MKNEGGKTTTKATAKRISEAKKIAIATSIFALCMIGVVAAGTSRYKSLISVSTPKSMDIASSTSRQLSYQSIGYGASDFNNLSKPTTAHRSYRPNEKNITPSQYTLEIGKRSSKLEAEKALSQLDSRGIRAYYTPMNNNGHVIYRIRSGVFSSSRLARIASHRLKSEKGLKSRAIRLQ